MPTVYLQMAVTRWFSMFPSIFPAVWATTWSHWTNYTLSLTTTHITDILMTYPSHPSLPESYQSKTRSELLTTTASSFVNKVGKLRTEAIPSMTATSRYSEPASWQVSKSTANNETAIIGLSETRYLAGVKPLPFENATIKNDVNKGSF